MDIKKLFEGMNVKQKIGTALTTAALGYGGYYYAQAAPVPVAVALLKKNTGSEVNTKFTVLSGKDFKDPTTNTPKSSVLNDTAKWQDATITVYINAVTCPALSFAALQGKTITVHGAITEYKDKLGKTKPEIKVSSPNQITIN